jgi:anti-sigma regulatory factor (Ser/Thr protein kinase)
VAGRSGDSHEGTSESAAPDRAEALATAAAVLSVCAVALIDGLFSGKFGLLGFMFIGPFIAAAFAGPRRTAMVGALVIFFAVVLTTPPRQYDQLNHLLRVTTAIALALVALWISHLRTQRGIALVTARSETREERRRREAAETAQWMQAVDRERLTLLSEVTRLLSSSLDPNMVMQRTMSLVVGRLADAAVVHVPGEQGLHQLGRRGTEFFEPETQRPLFAGNDVPFDNTATAAVAYRTGRLQMAQVPVALEGRDGVGEATAVAVPLAANGEVIGVMTFVDGPGRRFEPDDIALAVEVASRTGVALSNATRFQREHVVAEVLQRAVLPDFLPTVSGLAFDAEYRAGAAGTYVGGDWYDVFELDAERVVFSVGDVMGKGAPAAALMGQVRTAIRAYAVAGQTASEILSSLDLLFDALDEDRVVTAVVGTINPLTGRVELANAGHPPPLVVRADGKATVSWSESSLLIAAGLSGLARPEQSISLRPGDTLVMYSDGLVERRGELITAGMERLAEVATEIARNGWPDRPSETLVTRLGDEENRDDVVVLSVHYVPARDEFSPMPSGGTGRDGMSTLHLKPAVESTTMARHWMAARLDGMPVEVVECAALLTSELVTNAVLHAGTPLSVTLHFLSDRIRVDVADGSPVVPSVKDYGADAATGRGLTLFTTLASNWGVQRAVGGKIVWFEIPVDYPGIPDDFSDGSFRFDLLGIITAEDDEAADSPRVSVQLRGIPVALLQKSSEEYEGLFRELRLMKEHTETHPEAAAAIPERLSVLVSTIGARFHDLGPGMDELWQDVVDHHVATYDWNLTLPVSAVAHCEFYDAMLDEADEFGLSAQLLTLPASPTSVAVRRWFLSELIGQLHGKVPIPWSESRFHADLSLGAL